MPLPAHRSAYVREREILDAAIESERGVLYPVASIEAGNELRLRMYACREAERRASKEIFPDVKHPKHNTCPYDGLLMKVILHNNQHYLKIERPNEEEIRARIIPL